MLFLPFLLAALVASGLVAGVALGVVSVVRRPGHPVALFLLLWWAVLFLAITQFPTREGGFDHLNLVPFAAFARGHYFANAGTPVQYFLNIVLTVPLGLLLPIVSRWGLLRVVGIGLGIALATETVQYFTGRNADIDDVIANTAGVLVGYLVFTVARAVVRSARRTAAVAP